MQYIYEFLLKIGFITLVLSSHTPIALMVLDRFSSDNPTRWIFRADQYSHFLVSQKSNGYLLLPFISMVLLIIGSNGCIATNNFWLKHFTRKLALYFSNDSNIINDNDNTLDMMWKLDENFSSILCKVDNVQCALHAFS